MTWNYRVWKDGDEYFIVKETYYNDAGEISSCTKDAVFPSGSTLKELRSDIKRFTESLTKPVLITKDFVFAPMDS